MTTIYVVKPMVMREREKHLHAALAAYVGREMLRGWTPGNMLTRKIGIADPNSPIAGPTVV